MVEDKHTAYDLTKPEPLQQLVNYAASRGYELGLISNGKLFLEWDISNQNAPNSILYLDIEQLIQTYTGQTIFSQDLLKRMKEINRLPDCTIDRFNVYNTDSLLLPKQQEIRTPLLEPVLNLELSTVSQIKTKTSRFLDGFDFIVGNPPYVKADEPGVDGYRRRIEASGRFETLHEKWDLFVPFVELACKSVKNDGKIGLIVSRGFQTNNYAELLRDYIISNLKVTQVDFFNRISLFSDAVVSNTIFFLEKTSVSPTDTVKRILHRDSFEQTENLPSLSQIDYQAKVFGQFVVNFTLEDVIDLEDKGKIPKKDEDIATIFQQRKNLQLEISQKIDQIRETYQELNQMVDQLYNPSSSEQQQW